jgi:hypothetical protein
VCNLPITARLGREAREKLCALMLRRRSDRRGCCKIAERYSMNCDEVLENVAYARARNTDHLKAASEGCVNDCPH